MTFRTLLSFGLQAVVSKLYKDQTKGWSMPLKNGVVLPLSQGGDVSLHES